MVMDDNRATSRFQVVEVPVLPPGSCIITKKPTGSFIDTGVAFGQGDKPRFAGRVYLSFEAVWEMAAVAGMFDAWELRIGHAADDAYRQGYAEGLRENFRDTVDLVERLHDVADRLGGLRGAPLDPASASAALTGDPGPGEPGHDPAGDGPAGEQ